MKKKNSPSLLQRVNNIDAFQQQLAANIGDAWENIQQITGLISMLLAVATLLMEKGVITQEELDTIEGKVLEAMNVQKGDGDAGQA